jgi:hypothetical protein
MHEAIPQALPRAVLAMYQARPYTARGFDGRDYEIELEAIRLDEPGGTIHVVGLIDDGSDEPLFPLSEDFLATPEGKFIGES